ncbi:sugar ABC transporter substrate-binding protein [Paucibacter sp. R3-3]|uniref:Sugar ABC transporter substrate-binding protein n=1 Tax=Roseateles agri TaxID=3098619 RepID=A0ABU5DGY5_9BURK|nr:sugar ABC transporter substrate-binding protein [Paucibacter sp. R3-3]MDY0745547.1 sugar ABC transporter substrate-binding protein [Paucibacter sp. R3-3]
MRVTTKQSALLTALIGTAAALLPMTSAHAEGRYAFVSHAPDADSWWNTIKNSLKQVGEDFNVTVDYRNPPDGDLAGMARLIEQSAARGYDGVAFTIADINVLAKPAALVKAKGIPIVTVNSGTAEQSKQVGAIMHIGQPEYEAGKGAGERAKAAGIKSFVCVNHYATNAVSFERCRGFADALGVDAKKTMIDSGQDPTVVESKVTAYLRSNPTTQAVLALGPNAAEPTIKALEKMNLAGKMYFGTFDLSKDIVAAIKKGTINFAIDQQPYLQGYMGIAALVIAHEDKTQDPQAIIAKLKANPKFQARLNEYGLAPVYTAAGVSSGPGFVTKDNIEKVEKYAGQYR